MRQMRVKNLFRRQRRGEGFRRLPMIFRRVMTFTPALIGDALHDQRASIPFSVLKA